MRKTAFRRTALLALSAGVVATGGQIPAHAAAGPPLGSCLSIRQFAPNAPDGDYLLINGGHLITVYCADMSTTPKEYIDLATTGASVNFSQYTAGGASPGTSVRTTFTKLRIDPATLKVDIGDLAFASSAGSLLHAGSVRVTSMPYAVAMACVAPRNAAGVGNINLTGTPFQVTSTFQVGGASPAGSATVSSGNQVVSLTGGGFCGWITTAPTLFNPFNPSPGMFDLSLACTPQPVVSRHLCINIGRPAAVTEQAARWHGQPAMTVRYKGHAVAVVRADGRILS